MNNEFQDRIFGCIGDATDPIKVEACTGNRILLQSGLVINDRVIPFIGLTVVI